MQILLTSDVSETKRNALLYVMSCLCNDGVTLTLPLSDFARFCSTTATTEDLIAALELPAANPAVCENWKMSPQQWYSGLRQALYQRLVDALQSESIEAFMPEPVPHGRSGQC